MLNAVRDNLNVCGIHRATTQRIRYMAFIMAGFFAGVSGGWGAHRFRVVTGAEVANNRFIGTYLLFTFWGGATFFSDPSLGGLDGAGLRLLLSGTTKAWLLLYLG